MQKKIVTYLLLFYALFTIYNTLIPFKFDYGLGRLGEQISLIHWMPYFPSGHLVSLTDIVGNIILFMPFGALLCMSLIYRNKRNAILKTVLGGALLSFLIEFTQLFIAYRNTAPHDLINNILGSGIGAIVASVYFNRVSGYSRKIFYDLFNSKPFALILVIIGVSQSISAIMPFTVTINVSGIKKSLKAVNLIPFDYQSIGKLFVNSPNQNDLLPMDFTLFIENLLFWIVVGYLIMLCYQLYWKDSKRVKIIMAIAPAVYFSLLEFAQVFIVSRTTDINDIISGYLGIVAGYLIFIVINSFRPVEDENLDLLKIPLVLYAIFLVFAGLRPFDWTMSPEVLSQDLTASSLIPFYAYFRVSSLWNIFDLMNSILYFMPISLFWSYKLRSKGKSFRNIYLLTVSTGFMVGLGIEVIQVFSITRLAEITDTISFALGGGLGTFLVFYFEREIRPKLSLAEKDLEAHPV